MDFTGFTRLIAFDKELNPFHDSFSEGKLLAALRKDIDNDDVAKRIAFAFYILLSSIEYKEFYLQMRAIIGKPNISQAFYLYAIEMCNHESIVINEHINENLRAAKSIDSLEVSKMKMQTEVGSFNIVSMADEIIDLLDFMFSVIKYTSIPIKNLPQMSEVGTEMQRDFMKFYLTSNYHEVMKSIFELVCFEEVDIELKGRELTITNKNNEFDMLKNISYFRTMSNIAIASQRLDNDHVLKRVIDAQTFLGPKSIESCSISPESGIVTIKYRDKVADQILNSMFYLYAGTIATYHFHISKEATAKLDEIARVYCVLQRLAVSIEECSKIDYSKSSDESINPNYFQYKVMARYIIEMIVNVTGIDMSSAISILRLFENDGSKSFWERPILRNGNYLYLAFHSLKNANIANMIDFWLQAANIDIDEKGERFEGLVRDEIIRHSLEKKYFVNVQSQKKYYVGSKYEEIDLIWETKTLLVLGEVKCIRYPFTSRNVQENLKILKKAAMQIKRKKDFLFSSRESFPSIDFSKRAICCIVTNYPLFSGGTIESIPVIDIGILTRYLSVGAQIEAKMSSQGEEYVESVPLYSNEDEFSDNVENMIVDPDIVNVYKVHFKKETIKIPFSSKIDIVFEQIVHI